MKIKAAVDSKLIDSPAKYIIYNRISSYMFIMFSNKLDEEDSEIELG